MIIFHSELSSLPGWVPPIHFPPAFLQGGVPSVLSGFKTLYVHLLYRYNLLVNPSYKTYVHQRRYRKQVRLQIPQNPLHPIKSPVP